MRFPRMFRIKKYNISQLLLLAVLFLVLLRIVLAVAVPLLDKTEARYGEIARLMVETNEWWKLQVDYGTIFWAKPPLSTWLSALSFKLLGFNELAARLPSIILSIALILIICYKEKKRELSIFLPAFILITIPEFFIHIGVVSTDTTLAFCIAIAMLSFWEALQEECPVYWKYLFFIATGFGLLAKGPIMLVLTIPPILIWSVFHKISLFRIMKKLHWISGTFIALLIAVPWYLIAELKSPGFLDYFIIGEHFKRFFDSGWKGDLYGVPHNQPLGMIWLFLLVFAFPWIQLVFYKLWKERRSVLHNERLSFLAIWLLWIPFFFTFSSSIIHTYILPVMVPLALLVLHWWKDLKPKKIWLSMAAIFPVVILLAAVLFFSSDRSHNFLNSDKYLLSHLDEKPDFKELPVVYWKRKSFSGQFYSNSKMTLIRDELALDSMLRYHRNLYIIIPNKMRKAFPAEHSDNLMLQASNYKTSIFLLNHEGALTNYDPYETIERTKIVRK